MLKQLRKKENAKKVLWTLAIIIVPLFVLWGSASPLRGAGKKNYAGKVFGRKVSFEEFNENLQAVKTQAVMQFGDNFYKVQKFLNLETETWDRIIFLYEAKRRKIKVTNAEVIDAIKKYPFFQSNGKFDPRLYEDILMYSLRIAPRDFEEETRQNLKLTKLFDEVVKKVTIGDKELWEEYKKANEKVKVSFLLIAPSKFEKDISIDNSQVKDYYEKHKTDFKKPPSINIQYAGIDFTPQATPTEKAQMLEKVNSIYAQLKKGADFEKVAKDSGLPVKETGLFSQAGPIPAIGWSNEFRDTAFSLKDQGISRPVETPKGIYILKLKEKKGSYIASLAEAEPEIKKALTAQKTLELAYAKAREILERIKKISKTSKSLDFAKLSEFFGVEFKATNLFKYNEYIPSIGVTKEFQDAAFKLKDSNEKFSEVVPLPMGFCILKLENYQQADEKIFTQEKEKFKAQQLDAKKKEAFNSFFEKLRKEANLEDNISKNTFLPS